MSGQNPTVTPSSTTSQGHVSTEAEPQKRKRKALSCYDCKRRKLRCDRITPACGRCTASGKADSCRYDFQGLDEDDQEKQRDIDKRSTSPKDVSNDANDYQRSRRNNALADRVKYLETRLAELESRRLSRLEQPKSMLMSAAVNNGPENAVDLSVKEDAVALAETTFIRIRGFKSQFYGPTKAAAVVAHLPQLQQLMHSVFTWKSNGQVQSDFKNLRLQSKAEHRNPDVSHISDNLLDLLPPRSTVDEHVEAYIATFETTYRVLHVPSFRREYSEFWQSPSTHRRGFVAILLLLIAAVRPDCARAPFTYNYDSSVDRGESIIAIRASECWLEKQSHKHFTLTFLQVNCLLMIAKGVNQVKCKRAWQSSGSFLQFLMSAAFHRDPAEIDGKRLAPSGSLNRDVNRTIVGMSVFESEMRRRIWATAVEIELQASIERGMPSISNAYNFDTLAPLNVEDEDINEGTTVTPKPLSPDQFTSATYQHLAHASLKLRISLNACLNDPRTQLSYTSVLSYEREIQAHLTTLPDFTDPTRPGASISDTPGRALMANSLLRIQLLVFLLMIHSPFIHTSTNPSHTRYSVLATIRAATDIISLFHTLTSNSMFGLVLIRDDMFRAPMALAHAVLAAKLPADDLLITSLTLPASKAIAQALEILGACMVRVGSGAREAWVISAAKALVKTKAEPSKAEQFKG
ncbi:hypothetical protein EJ05DRAFT_477420 [Pseudovirgaria hyperparasitica]|uniref:Zn(2)-C6 fungal-type domain-containing protein n=1 Tax=Pseudovirgaria hyperparasitica TaxID=470096 RepID=A0A6A6W589_9PEZI|nr:uncharacterized protein EJ05DRAFT_477420 [Pseudovirgaria hyperparasitica]KAF2757204.1 hypothetical protein EJ05DRAFT_477420 [Pseudovirgaria hyperparasitica]